MRSVLITGITGFLGSHIAEQLISNNIRVIGMKRQSSDIWRCNGFKEDIHWVDINLEGGFADQLDGISFDTIIHAAWIGVEARDRDNWSEQSKNINFLIELLSCAKVHEVNKFIFLGSQAEYGNINGEIDESHDTTALNAYGGIKLACLEILKAYSISNSIDWIWLRIFSLFGEMENDNWLIPSIVNKMLNGNEMDVTAGEQKYAYLYVKDFASIISTIVTLPIDSGIYNISGQYVVTIRTLLEQIRDIINPGFIFNFGALPYREHQSMHLQGKIDKILNQIKEIEFTDFSVALQNTLTYYKK